MPDEKVAREKVEFFCGADGRCFLTCDGEVVQEMRLRAGTELILKVDGLYGFKTTMGRRDQYHGTKAKAKAGA